MKINVLLFASLKEAAGTDAVTVEIEPGQTVSDLLIQLAATCPQLQGRLDAVRVAVDHEFRSPSDTVPADREVALIPPVSGG